MFSNGIVLKFGARNIFYVKNRRDKMYKNDSYYQNTDHTLRSYYASASVPFGKKKKKKKVSDTQNCGGSSGKYEEGVKAE